MNAKLKLLCSAFALLTALQGFAQKTITRQVKDTDGEPLIGVTVSLGGGKGTVTDINGRFTLSGVQPQQNYIHPHSSFAMLRG